MATDITNFKSNILSFVDSMHCENEPLSHYKLFSRAEHSPFASAFALFIKYMMGEVDKFTSDERHEWIYYFKSLQDEKTGLFIDKNASIRVVDERHDVDHLNQQLTTFCITALECLDTQADYPLNFLNEIIDEQSIEAWLNNLDWSNPWNSGNKVMFIGICAIYNLEKFQDSQSQKTLDHWFQWMNANQDPRTGYWGNSKTSKYFYGMGGFYHQLVIYHYLKKNVNHWEQVIDSTLFIQLKDGGYNPEMGGASCDDLDAIDPLVHSYHHYDYRRSDIENSLGETLKLILNNQNSDHGFCWSKHNWYDLKPYFYLISDFIRKKDKYYSYLCLRGLLRGKKKDIIKQGVITGWSMNDRKESESSLFDTWLRLTAIGEITSILTNEPLAKLEMKFLKAPGLGWFEINKNQL
jgi:hypothetical protein